VGEPIDDIISWSASQQPWRRDCLRRLAIANDLTEADQDELLAMIKQAAGFNLASEPPAPIAFAKEHFGGCEQPPVVLKGIANVEGVNRLVAKASLRFCPKALTIVYGRNGSGKSGFVRILRTACRTRIENPAILKVLADVYGDGTGAQAADILVDLGNGDVPIAWTPGMAAAPQLAQVAVFDSASAQLYVDGGNQIRYLPFGLALPHRLNTVCLALKAKLEAEQLTVVGGKVALTSIAFPIARKTVAQTFNTGLSKTTPDAEIDAKTAWSEDDAVRLQEITNLLEAGATTASDLGVLLSWIDAVKLECEGATHALSDEALAAHTALRDTATAAREAAQLAAGALFDDAPLNGVGSQTWRALWQAARDYSVTEAYPDQPFPVVGDDAESTACVLCQQSLDAGGIDRMQRFQAYMDDALDTAATTAEVAVTDALASLPALPHLLGENIAGRIEQVRVRDAMLADALESFQAVVVGRHANAKGRLTGAELVNVAPLISPLAAVEALSTKLGDEITALAKASLEEGRQELEMEKAELEDRKILHTNKAKLSTRRDLMVTDAAYAEALNLVTTTGITKRANELIDTHLTAAVVSRFDAERTNLDILHLKVGLARKSGQTRAEFEIDPQTKLTKVTSQILSEGEQRALALAGFLTEVALTDGSGPIVIDDPVSSLDRDRSAKVANRIAAEALDRQVVVFTHDIIFFNELCRTADNVGIEPITIALFSDLDAAGKIDAAGMVWKGLTVAKRIGAIRNAFAPMPKIHASSPADYEFAIKNLYGRLRDTYERVVEEIIFSGIVQRGVDVIQTQMLRNVTLPDDLAIRFHDGMTRANTHSHDNPAADTVPVPTPDQFTAHLGELEQLIEDFKSAKAAAEAARPQMKPKK
jgi:energy-coupling factor transporter ATP-binding protein EcfA2